MSDDPFSPEADPYPEPPKLGRRDVAKLLVLSTTVLSSCAAHRRLACQSQPNNTERCQAKFCRYYTPNRSA